MYSNKLKKTINWTVGLFGLAIVNKRTSDKMFIPFDIDPEFKQLYEKTESYTMTTIERMFTLYQAIQYVVSNEIGGDMVECGVYKGGSMMLCAYTLQQLHDSSRKLYLYDTFTGMTQPTDKDVRYGTEESAIKLWNQRKREDGNEWSSTSLEEVKKNMRQTKYPDNKITYVKGKVEDTIPDVTPSQISILRLDTDFYESTKHELVHLFPQLAPGGVLIIDDYGSWRGCRKAVDEYFKENKIPFFFVRCDYACAVGVKME